MRPYKFKPFLKSTLWGGTGIATFKGMDIQQEDIGESWEVSGMPGYESVTAFRGIDPDPDLGLTLPQLIEKYKDKLVGKEVYQTYGNHFPLLAKFIGARDDLSLQVHPNDELARQRHGCEGKNEMWYVIKSDPGAKIHVGLRKETTSEEFTRLVASDSENKQQMLGDLINSVDSHPGDVFYLPAGRLHAIGAGNLIAEIQEASDITYRVYDYDRKDADGQPRELHVDLAKEAIDYHVYPEYRKSYDSSQALSELVSCPFFQVHRAEVRESARIDFHRDSFVLVMCIKGQATLNEVEMRQGESLLVPACSNSLSVVGNATFLTATL